MHALRKENGQALVIVAIALVVLMAFVALAVDVGQWYQQRRQMQNAADAGALAGAKVLCMQGLGATTAARNAAVTYAQSNGAQTAPVTVPYQQGSCASQTNCVSVTAQTTANNLFARAAQVITPTSISADAIAACGAPNTGCGLWPVAITIHDWNDAKALGCGASITLWSDVSRGLLRFGRPTDPDLAGTVSGAVNNACEGAHQNTESGGSEST
jgi:Flp pilus assembly protein TadG